MHTLDGGRIGIAAQALGLAEGALNNTIAYVKKENSSAEQSALSRTPSSSLQIWLPRLNVPSCLFTRLLWQRLPSPYILWKLQKLSCTLQRLQWKLQPKAVQLHGGYGYTREYDVERMMRDAKITEIYEGTSEVQRMVISGAHC